jgi:hypothetical protein
VVYVQSNPNISTHSHSNIHIPSHHPSTPLRWRSPLIDQTNAKLILALLGEDSTNVTANTLDLSESPNLQRGPAVSNALSVGFKNVIALPALLQVVVLEVRNLGESM